ncbi:unnamed protein product [Toxocara canis]|uniref:Major sperm protein n=1 Tax=Toxocara canis TaxID=6265 RepID=A0A183UJQ9_TOXCA|nr:unnamed protein product [Toxocara canis]
MSVSINERIHYQPLYCDANHRSLPFDKAKRELVESMWTFIVLIMSHLSFPVVLIASCRPKKQTAKPTIVAPLPAPKPEEKPEGDKREGEKPEGDKKEGESDQKKSESETAKKEVEKKDQNAEEKKVRAGRRFAFKWIPRWPIIEILTYNSSRTFDEANNEGEKKEQESSKKERAEEKKEPEEEKTPYMPKDLHWRSEEGTVKYGVQKILLMNTVGKRQAFKMKCTDNNIYTVKPTYTFLEKDEVVDIEVTRVEGGEAKEDKIFLFHMTVVTKAWKIYNAGYCREAFLRYLITQGCADKQA